MGYLNKEEKIMKKTLFYISLAVLAISCVKEQNPGQNTRKELVPMEFNAMTEGALDDTRTSLAADGASVKWIKGDKVLIFDDSNVADDGTDNGVVFTAQSSGAKVVISGEADPAAAEYYALYPSASGKMSPTNVFTSKIAVQQIVTAGTMADDCAVMIARATDRNMEFKNVTALVEFNLQVEGVRSLTLIGNNNEKITGTFTAVWNDGEPVATSTVPEVTATLRDKDNADLAQGKYYFTILPTNFTEGFSVILGMNDGTQKIVKRTAAADVKRNEIFCTQDVPANAIKSYSSNFVKYNDGFALTYAHLTVNKAGNGDKYATYVNDGKGSISSAGVYFVGPESTDVELAVLGVTGLVVAGDNPEVRSMIKSQSKAIQAQENANGYIVLSGLDIKSSPSQVVLQQTESKGGFANFGSIVIDDCKLVLIENMVNCHNRGMSLANFVLQDSDVMINAAKAASYMFNCGSQVSTVASVKFTNNVFQNVAESESDILATFKLVNGANGLTVGDLDMTHNTLVGTTTGSKGYANVKAFAGDLVAAYNFFVHTHTIDKMEILQSGSYADAKSLTIKNNYYFINNWNNRFWAATGTFPDTMTKETTNPVPFVSYPLSADWDPENGVFGYADGLRYGSLVTSTSPYTVTDKGPVSTSYGAQRTTTAAVLNRAGYAYSSKVLGNL